MMEGSLPTVTVVVPTAGGRAEIIATTLPVLLADPATTEVIVACDRVDAETRELIDSVGRSDERVRSVEASSEEGADNRGQAARDAGVRVARGEVVLALDDDVEPQAGLVSGHARRHAAATTDSIVLGHMPVALAPGSRLSGAVRLYAEAYEDACAGWRADEANVLTGLWGGHFSLHRERWLEVSAEAPRVEAGYHVDREFGLRLREAGVRPVFDPDLRAIHRFQRTAPELLRDARSSGRAQALLHAEFPELVPAAREYTEQTPALVRGLVRLSRSRRGWSAVSATLLALDRALAFAHLGAAQYAVAKAVRRVGFARGVREAG